MGIKPKKQSAEFYELTGGRSKSHRPPPAEPLKTNKTKITPVPPTYLNDRAKAEWKRVAKELFKNNMLTRIDYSQLAAYCEAFSTWVEAQMIIQKDGLMMYTPNGYPMAHPMISVMNKARADMKKSANEFGMTPVSRSKFEAPVVEKPEDPMEDFLKSRTLRKV